jgi:hypothetical protein
VTKDTVQDAWGNPTRITAVTEDHANNKRFRQVTDNQYASSSMTVSGEPRETGSGRIMHI